MSSLKNTASVFITCCFTFLLHSCSVTKQINKQAVNILLHDSVIQTGHAGISIYEPATNTYWYNYNAEKYFVPGSNVKLFSLYAGMKYLGDSLVGLRYFYSDSAQNKDRVLVMIPTGDPTFLHEDYVKQPVFDFLRKDSATFNAICIYDTVWKENALGYGWSWDDYNEPYMTERNSFPVFGNVVNIELASYEERKNFYDQIENRFHAVPTAKMFKTSSSYFDSLINNNLAWDRDIDLQNIIDRNDLIPRIDIKRDINENQFWFQASQSKFTNQHIPLHFSDAKNLRFKYNDNRVQYSFIKNRLKKYPFWAVGEIHDSIDNEIRLSGSDSRIRSIPVGPINAIKSRPSDSLLKPMMHNSDNFFAEQTLLMASNEKLGYMNDEAIIDTLLKTDLKDIPQKPKWVDGSGLSRYNLFTPQDFIYILNKMKDEFGLERLKTILPTGNTGTLKNYYVTDSSFIYAKTGTLSNQIALSGFLITKKNKLLIFSVLNNNFTGRATAVRRAVEKFIKAIRENY